jgi:hypothetical protein
LFFSPINIQLYSSALEDYDMTYATYYRNDIDFAWRFTSLRSGQPAASVRSLPGGNRLSAASLADCRTPQ